MMMVSDTISCHHHSTVITVQCGHVDHFWAVILMLLAMLDTLH